MKPFLFFPLLAVIVTNIHTSTNFLPAIKTDTAGINHLQDGIISEWPDSLFQTDKGTTIQYAVDNNTQNLYVAMKIPDFRMQMKMMRLGMNLYIDLKGKKKEGRGIEFPIKRESDGGFSNGQNNDANQQGNNQTGGFDKKAMRSRYAIYMFSMKLFGFTDGDPVTQGIQTEGSANITFSWDANDIMYVEYLIPLNMLGDAASLNQKNISLGWKINGVETPTTFSSNAPTTTTTRVVRVPSGTIPSVNQGNAFNSNGPSQADMDKMMQEQSFWMKYIFH